MRTVWPCPRQVLGLAAMSLLAAVLSWRFVEQPIRARAGWWTARRLWAGVALLLLLVLAFGVWVVKTRGWPTRFPDYVQRASSAVFFNTPRDGCFRRGDSSKDAPERFCHFGAPGAPSLLLWGDSHANQYLSALSMPLWRWGRAGWCHPEWLPRHCGQRSGLPATIAYAS